MKHPTLFLSLTISLFAPCLLSAQKTTELTSSNTIKKRPNIILFLVDDMGWQDTSVPFWYDANGNPKPTFLNKRYKTPNMEKLAAQGMLFTNAYAQAVCSPSRTSLMTGMNSARHRVTNWTLDCDRSTDANHPTLIPPKDWNINGLQPVGTLATGQTVLPIKETSISYQMTKPFLTAMTFPELLKRNGYTTIHCGKAHWGTQNTPGANPKNLGFIYNIAGTEIGGPGDYRGHRQYGKGHRFHIQGLDENNYYKDDVFLTEALTQEALKCLDKIQNSPEAQKPFYLYMSHYAIHAPLDQRSYDKRFAEKYKNPQDGASWNNYEKHYAALIEGMDKSLGDIMTYLEKKNLMENTIILFMADNGGLAISGRLGNQKANYPLSFGKGSGCEGGIREPMIVSWPGITKSGSICHSQVIIEDFFPTILEMGQVKNSDVKNQITQKIDGRSFVPLLKGKNWQDRLLLFHCPNIWGEGCGNHRNYHPYTAMRKNNFKLIYWHADQRFELFDLSQDISEKKDLSKDPTYTEIVKNMAQEMGKTLTQRQAQMPKYKAKNMLGVPENTPVPLPNEAINHYLK